MAETVKTLGQAAPPAATLTALYTVPVGTRAVISSLMVCNRSTVADTFRVSIALAGAVDTAAQYIYYDLPLLGKNTFAAVLGVALGPTDVVRCYSTNGTTVFNAFGVEIS